MFDMIAVAKCDICTRTFTWKPVVFKVEAPFRRRVPDDWHLVSISGVDKTKQVLVCDDHGPDKLRDIIDLMEKPVELAPPPSTNDVA